MLQCGPCPLACFSSFRTRPLAHDCFLSLMSEHVSRVSQRTLRVSLDRRSGRITHDLLWQHCLCTSTARGDTARRDALTIEVASASVPLPLRRATRVERPQDLTSAGATAAHDPIFPERAHQRVIERIRHRGITKDSWSSPTWFSAV